MPGVEERGVTLLACSRGAQKTVLVKIREALINSQLYVILSAAKNLVLGKISKLRDSSVAPLPQNDRKQNKSEFP